MRCVALASLYEPLEFLETRISNLNACDMRDVLVYFADCSPAETWVHVEKILKRCEFDFIGRHFPDRKTLYWTWNFIIEETRRSIAPSFFTNVNVDDIHAPDYFQKLMAHLDAHEEFALVAPHWLVGRKKGQLWPPLKVDPGAAAPDPARTMGHFPMWRARLHDHVGLFDPRMLIVGDAYFWTRIRNHLGLGVMGTYPEPLACYLDHDANLSKTAVGLNGMRGEAHDRDLVKVDRQEEEIGQLRKKLARQTTEFERMNRANYRVVALLRKMFSVFESNGANYFVRDLPLQVVADWKQEAEDSLPREDDDHGGA